MAKIYTKKSPMQEQYDSYRKKAKTFFPIGIGCWVILFLNIMIFHTFNPLFTVPIILGFAGFGGYGRYCWRKSEQMGSGLTGKQQTLSFVSSLPDTYSVVTNPSITYQGQTSMLDTVVIGPNGVFIIQTKNQNGTIEGSYEDDQFIQHKIGQKGTPYTASFRNPIKQVSTHVFRLSKLLQEYGYNVWVQGMVYFSNPATAVNVYYDEDSFPIFAASQGGEREMCNYITSYEQKTTLSQNDIDKIAGILV